MKPIFFPESNLTLAKDQPQYMPLPVHRVPNDPTGRVVSCWKLNWRERLDVLLQGKVWQQTLTFNRNLQPQLLSTIQPEMKP